MNNGDKDFAEYLDGRSTISKQYAELGAAEPPAALDAAILDAAGHAAKMHSSPVGRRSWMVPLSVAATVMICLSLALNILREAPTGVGVDQDFDAVVPAGAPEAPAQSIEGKMRSQAATPQGVMVKRESAGRMEEAGNTSLPQGFSQSRKKENSDDRQFNRAEETPEPAGGLMMDAILPAKPAEERAVAPMALSQISPDSIEADQLLVLGQMMEIVTGYLESGSAGMDESSAQMESLSIADDLVTEDSARSSGSVLSSLTADRKSDLPEQDQAPTAEPDSELRRIAELYEQSQNKDTGAALAEFRDAFPDHPVSRLLLERGY